MTMEKIHKNYDVFHAFLVENADYEGRLELPVLKTSKLIPERVITFSKAMAKNTTEYDKWVHFYEHDKSYERLWNNPKQYLAKLQKFKGIITPDFSLYRNMPLVMQEWNTYRGRALSVWLQNNGVEIIPNVRWNDERTYEFCYCGITKNSTVAVGTHGCIKQKADRECFKRGLKELVSRLSPNTIVVYGAMPETIFKEYREIGITIICFESEYSQTREQQVTA